MKMKKSAKCINCEFGRYIYRKIGMSFKRENIFYCTRFEMIIQPDDVCEGWSKNVDKSNLSLEKLDSAEQDILFIAE